MRPNLLPAFVFCAFLLIEVGAEEQSSGYSAEGYATSGDDDADSNEGSGANGQEVQKVIDAMRKLNKNKSDDDLSKNIKTGKILRNLPLRTFEKLSALWISIIRRLWKVWKAKGARQVMHSIVEKLVTHTGKKVSSKVGKLLDANPEKSYAAALQKSALPSEKNVLDQASQNGSSTYLQPGTDNPGDEDTEKDDKQTSAGPQVAMTSATKEQYEIKQATPGTNVADSNNAPPQQLKTENQVDSSATSSQNGDDNNAARANAASRSKGLSIAVDNQSATSELAKNGDENDATAEQGSRNRNMIPQEQTPESITSNIGMPAETALHKTNKKTKHVKNKKRYKMHRHTRTAHKSLKHRLKKQKDTHVKYVNVDKHLIKRGKGSATKPSGNEVGWTQASSHEAPISKQLESVLNAKAAQEQAYFKTKANRKRSFASDNKRSRIEDLDYDDYDYNYDDASDESSGTSTTNRKRSNGRYSARYGLAKEGKAKKRKSSKKLKNSRAFSTKRKNSSKSGKNYEQSASYNGNKTFQTKPVKYEAPVRKFKFFGVPQNEGVARNDVQAENTTSTQAVIPILNIESTPTKTPNQNSEPSDNDVAGPAFMGQSPQPWNWKNALGHSAVIGQSGTEATFKPEGPPEGQDAPSLLLLRPTMQHPGGEERGSPVIVPTSSGRPIVPIIPTEDQNLPDDDASPDGDQDGNSTSFVPAEETVGQVSQASALTEELKSLESRMTVVEAAVAEIIEWIRTRGQIPQRETLPSEQENSPTDEQEMPVLRLRPALPYPRPDVDNSPPQQEKTLLHHPRLLKQIFIPLPPPNTEAEKEVESGEPVNGLPFPLNFIVAKILAKMVKERDDKIAAAVHPHTPLPDVNIPAIEHDINRLELELGSVPKPFNHHRHHRFKLHLPQPEENAKMPILNQLLNSDARDEEPSCASPCQNGGICMGDNICHCPAPFTGPTCGSMTLIKVAKPTRRIVVEAPDANVLEALRRRAFSQYSDRYIPAQIRDHRDRRRLVRMLKGLLRNIAVENMRPEYARRSKIVTNNMTPDNIATGAKPLVGNV